MGKKMKLPFLSKTNSSWPWPSCQQPRTLSFRTTNPNKINMMFKTLNSAYCDVSNDVETTESSMFTNTSESTTASFSTASDESSGDSVETVIRGLRSERLFFEPGETSSILEEAKTGGIPFKESLVLSMESQDPYVDFRKSMEEMVEAHGLKDWEDLEELLCCYLKMNGKSNHGYIVGAFVDLLVGLAFASSNSNSDFVTCSSSALASCSCSRSPSSPLSFYTSSSSEYSSSTPCVSLLEPEEIDSTVNPCLSSLLEAEDEIEEQNAKASCSSSSSSS
ncbi:Transcription repressor OFP13 [Melia azedarach]|uniref:Transcription repressor OFP13 n=1 Tax=Melia azedarach TaxID=155640 RepID=A0ACC1X1M9_MELAZ|nr:Transcription repressor OFP13 [Melia azedarach]